MSVVYLHRSDDALCELGGRGDISAGVRQVSSRDDELARANSVASGTVDFGVAGINVLESTLLKRVTEGEGNLYISLVHAVIFILKDLQQRCRSEG